MQKTKPTPDQWNRLFSLSEKIWRLAPWEKLSEGDILGVRIPDGGPTVFLSAMGSLGEHVALVAYIGPRALFEVMGVQNSPGLVDPYMLLEIHNCSVSFEARRDLETQDLAALRKTDLKFERNGYPSFRQTIPGFIPEMIDADHARILIFAFEQFVEIYPRAETQDGYLYREDEVLVREPIEIDGKIDWTESWQTIRYPEPDHFKVTIPDEAANQIRELPLKKRTVVQMDAFPFPTHTTENGSIPRVLAALSKSGDETVGFAVMERARTDEGNLQKLADGFVETILEIGYRPGKIIYFSDEFENLAGELGDRLGLSFKPGTDYTAFQELREHFRRLIASELGFDEFGPA